MVGEKEFGIEEDAEVFNLRGPRNNGMLAAEWWRGRRTSAGKEDDLCFKCVYL